MAQFDPALKLLFQRSASTLLREIAGVSIERWLNVELPKVQNPRVDLLGESADGRLIHFEFQKENDRRMEYRMAEYYLAIYRLLNRHPTQIVIYVGQEPMRMKERLETAAMSHQYQLVDIRTLNGRALLESPRVEDRILAILADVPDRSEAAQRILAAIAQCEPEERTELVAQFLVIAGLRQLENTVLEEARKMAISAESLIRENKVLGPLLAKAEQEARQKGLQEGRQEGLQEGRQEGVREGRQEGELFLIRRLIEKRFGAIPAWADERFSKSSAAELEELGLRILDASNLEDLLG